MECTWLDTCRFYRYLSIVYDHIVNPGRYGKLWELNLIRGKLTVANAPPTLTGRVVRPAAAP
jgi:hypothetical protein